MGILEELREKYGLPFEPGEPGGYADLFAKVDRAIEALIENIATHKRTITIPVAVGSEAWLVGFSRRSGWAFEWERIEAVTDDEWYLATLTPPKEENT